MILNICIDCPNCLVRNGNSITNIGTMKNAKIERRPTIIDDTIPTLKEKLVASLILIFDFSLTLGNSA